MKKLYTVWALLVVASGLLVSLVVVALDGLRREEAQSAQLTGVARTIEDQFFVRHREEMGWLATQPAVLEALRNSRRPHADLSVLLGQTRGLLGLDLTYLVDRGGQVVACSEPRYVGTDVSFRPYVKAAFAGQPAYALSVGVATATRGLYAAFPAYLDGKVEGLVAFRTSALALDRCIEATPNVFLVDPTGSVFSAASALAPRLPTRDWSSDAIVRVGDQNYRVARMPLSVVKGFVLVSLVPEEWPWEAWSLALGVHLLLGLLVFVLLERARLLRGRRVQTRDLVQQQLVLANLLEGIAVLDEKGNLVWTNPAFDRLAQVTPGSPRVTLDDLWDSKGPGPWHEVIAGRRPWVVFESVLKGALGSWTPVTAGFTAAGGRFLLSVLDRTERHRSDQLIQHSQKLTVLGQLAGGVAHDLNNMLGVLAGMADLMKMSLPEQDPLQESVDLILMTLGRAATLSEKMLNFARQAPIERVQVDINRLLRELKFLARTALPEGVETTFVADETPVFVVGDESLLISALLNLVLNAGDAMAGTGTVTIEGTLVDAEHYRLVVTDQGQGMDKATLERVFEPFFSTKGKQGTGLGLSLVRKTVLDHKGTIKVESEVGQGTRVTIQLPVASIWYPAPESTPLPPATT